MRHTSAFLAAILAATLSTAAASAQETTQERPAPFRHLDQNATITVNFQDEDLGEILEMFSTNYQLNLVYGADVVGTVTMNFFNAPVEEALAQLLRANNLTYEVDGSFIVVQPLAAGAAQTGQGSKFPPTVIYLNHVQAEDMRPIIEPMLAGTESVIQSQKVQAGIENLSDLGGKGEASRDFLVVYASEGTLAKIQELIQTLDKPPAQILVEATILSVTLSDDFQLGFDFTALGGVDFQALGGSSNINEGLDSFVGTNGSTGNEWLFGAEQKGFNNNDSSGLHLGILRNQVGVFVNALEEVTNATVLSNPQILTVNRHAAELLVGRKLPYITTNVTQTSSTQTVSFLEVGTSLVFRPYVTDDGYIRMEINPKKSDGFINALGLPEETTTEVSTNVLVKDGNTVVIGGLIENQLATTESQVPFLGDLPWIGSLFRSTIEQESKNEVIVLLTPHIVSDSELSLLAEEKRARLETAIAHLAASHTGYLRPSYARRMYAEATAALAAGDPEKALAKAEWGLTAMPADPDLAAVVNHCREELVSARYEDEEMEDTLRLLEDKGAGRVQVPSEYTEETEPTEEVVEEEPVTDPEAEPSLEPAVEEPATEEPVAEEPAEEPGNGESGDGSTQTPGNDQ
jgi:type IV pilus secretin PilQ/predicted competence protein